MAIETLGIGLIRAIPSIVRDTRRLAVEFRKWREKKRLRRPPMVKFLDRVLVQMHEIVEDYENMLLTLERGLQSEAKTRKALLEFQKSRDRLIFERARLFAELSHVIKSRSPAPVRAFFRSLLRILDARELGADSSKATRHTLAKHVIAELEPEARITFQSRSLARKRIQEAREFLRSRWEDSHAKYLRARSQAEEGGDGIPPDVGRIIKKSRHPKSTNTQRRSGSAPPQRPKRRKST